jgi:hypothetical protein
MKYQIREENMGRLEKKLKTIAKKCEKTKCSFNFEITGEVFKEVKNTLGDVIDTFKYIEVEVEGEAKYNGWRFVATLDHHAEGNVVRAFDTELVIPDKYKTCGPTCEHCNKIRSRKDTYLVYNDETSEFKQVGKSCLQEFTHGLSAEDAAFFCSVYDQMESLGSYLGTSSTSYLNVEDILKFAFECYKHWGYQKSINSFYDENPPIGYRSTSTRVTDYYFIRRVPSKVREALQAEMDEVGFNPDSEDTLATTKAALAWIRNLEEKDIDSSYIRNLHIICCDKYTEWRNLGILVSLAAAYNRHIGQLKAYEKKQRAAEAEKAASDYLGQVKDKITVATSNFACISSWENMFGTTYLYKFTDDDGNVCIWYASRPVNNEDKVNSVTGTVKDLAEYNGVKQTVLTRCKVSYR